jgi:rhomboid protease GluP
MMLNSDSSRPGAEQPPGTSPGNLTHPETGAGSAPPEKGVYVRIELPRVKPWVCYGLIGLTGFIFILQLLSNVLLGGDLPGALGAKSNEAIRAGEIWRFITPVFLHGSLIHIGFNLYALYAIGPGLEKHYGRLRFTLLYFLSAFSGNVLSFIFSINPSLGASTAIFGLIAAEGIFIFRNRFLFGANSKSMLINIGGIVLVNFILGLSPGIDNWGHLGGLLGGLGFAWFAGPRLEVSRGEGGYFLFDRTEAKNTWLALLVEGLIFGGLAALF